MNSFTYWDDLNMTCRMVVVLIVILKLTLFFPQYRLGERIGLGIVGGCALMSGRVILDGADSPFAPWANALFALGVAIYFFSRLMRQLHHWRANREQIRRAKIRSGERG